MSHIEDLIAHHCPNGVEYLRISDLGDFVSGLKGKTKADFTNGNAKFVSYKNVFDNIEVDFSTLESVKTNDGERQTKLRRGDLIFTSSSENLDESGMTSVVTKDLKEDIFLNSFCFFVHLPKSVKPEFAKHLFRSTGMRKQIIKCANGVTRYNISKKALAKIKFPVPPLEVQDEIVRILDSYTQLKTDLESELEAELKARGKQYEYYRDWLLSLEYLINSCELSTDDLIPLVELTIRPDRLNWADRDSKNAKYIDLSSVDRSTGRIGDLTEITESDSPSRAQQIVKNNDVLFGTTRPLLRRVAYIPLQLNNEICSTGFCVLRCKNGRLNPRFLYHYIQSNEFYKYVESFQSGASYPSISDKKVKEFKIPVPPLSEQERIVAILDKFDALVNDLSSGLPAEIEARRKQYEYYRDQLLTFTPAK